ncbi:MAG: hemolysin III family protein [Flavobacteriaceae bacterium]
MSANKTERVTFYPPLEEKLNIFSHGFGLLLSIAALTLLVVRASLYGNVWHIVSFSIYGTSMILLYSASTIYHNSKKPKIRLRLQIFDHAAIYVLIAGTYTPFTLVTLNGTTGWIMFGVTWLFALTGIILKILFTGRFETVSTIMYVLMGWIVIFAIKPLIHNLPFEGLMWLFSGGISYTVGAVLYSIKKIPYNHAIFHVFVLVGSFCHFIAVYFYVLQIN